MKLDLNLNIYQQQKLAITQSMRQSINILQMSSYELREYVDKEFEENPVLEEELYFEEKIEGYIEKVHNKDDIKHLKSNNYVSNFDYSQYEEVSPFNFIEKKKSLKDYLYEQIIEMKLNNKIRDIIEFMIESLDYRGYLVESLEDICNMLKIKYDDGIEALKIIQNLEPYGIAARDLGECLIIQLNKRKDKLDNILKNIILNYLEYVADNNYKYIAKELNITPKQAQEYGDIIKGLEPKPSRGFYTGDEVKFIIPDAYVVKIHDNYEIIMNNDVIPKLRVNDLYKYSFYDDNKSSREYEYIKEKIYSAINLIKAINQRESTLLRVLEYVVKKQQMCFEKGKKYIKPMTLKEVALEIGVHESTVSRAIRNKYILTNFGTVKIKDLFSTTIAIKGTVNEDISVDNIKNRIRGLIEGENKAKPLSDQAICNILNNDNLNISRRTIAKYREELGIKSSSKRKRL